MTMTKKHFISLAEELAYRYSDDEERAKAVEVMSDFCKQHNPRFNRQTFSDAVEKVYTERQKAIKETLENA